MSKYYVRVTVGDGGECYAEAWPDEFLPEGCDMIKYGMAIEANSTYEAIHAGIARHQSAEYVDETTRFYNDHGITLSIVQELPDEHRKFVHDRRAEERKKLFAKS
jgi:hypothetical protein